MTRTREGGERKRVKKRREVKWKTDKLISEEKNKGRRREWGGCKIGRR